jgi:hypothetical protein
LVRLVASVAFNLATIDVIASADKHGIILATTGACTATWGTVSIFRQAAKAGVLIAIVWGVGEIRRREIIIGGAGGYHSGIMRRLLAGRGKKRVVEGRRIRTSSLNSGYRRTSS